MITRFHLAPPCPSPPYRQTLPASANRKNTKIKSGMAGNRFDCKRIIILFYAESACHAVPCLAVYPLYSTVHVHVVSFSHAPHTAPLVYIHNTTAFIYNKIYVVVIINAIFFSRFFFFYTCIGRCISFYTHLLSSRHTRVIHWHIKRTRAYTRYIHCMCRGEIHCIYARLYKAKFSRCPRQMYADPSGVF